jgi:hypothetical protein
MNPGLNRDKLGWGRVRGCGAGCAAVLLVMNPGLNRDKLGWGRVRGCGVGLPTEFTSVGARIHH